MLMIGTASHHAGLGTPKQPVTSELTGEELWNLTQMGYAPLRLVLGTSVYALGLVGGLSAFFHSFARGELADVTRRVYHPRANCTAHIQVEAEALRAGGAAHDDDPVPVPGLGRAAEPLDPGLLARPLGRCLRRGVQRRQEPVDADPPRLGQGQESLDIGRLDRVALPRRVDVNRQPVG